MICKSLSATILGCEEHSGETGAILTTKDLQNKEPCGGNDVKSLQGPTKSSLRENLISKLSPEGTSELHACLNLLFRQFDLAVQVEKPWRCPRPGKPIEATQRVPEGRNNQEPGT